MNNLTIGTRVQFYNSSYTGLAPNITALSSTKFAIGSFKTGTPANCVQVGTTDGSLTPTITLNGATVTYYNYGTWAVAALDATHFVESHRRDNENPNRGMSICTVSGTSVTVGAEQTLPGADQSQILFAKIDSTSFVGATSSGTTAGAFIGTVSGNTITSSAVTSMFGITGYNEDLQVALLDSSHFVVVACGNTDSLKAVVCSFSGTTISYNAGNIVTLDSGRGLNIGLTATDSTHYIVTYNAVGDSNKGKAIACSVSGTTSTVGVATNFTANSVLYTGAVSFDSTNFVVAYFDQTDSKKGKVVSGEISGTTLSFGTPSTFDSDNIGNGQSDAGYGKPIIAKLDSSHFIISYNNFTQSSSYVIVGSSNAPTLLNKVTGNMKTIAVSRASFY